MVQANFLLLCSVIASPLSVHLSSARTAVYHIKSVSQVSYLFYHDFCFAALSYFFHLIFQTTNLELCHNPFFPSVNILYCLFGKSYFSMQEDFALVWLNLPKFPYYFSDPYWFLSLQTTIFSHGFVPFVLTDHCLFGCSTSLHVVIFSLSAHQGLVLALASNEAGRHAPPPPPPLPRAIKVSMGQAFSRSINLQSLF